MQLMAKNILVVDDEPESGKQILKRKDIQLRWLKTGDFLSQLQKTFRPGLLDIMMPGLTTKQILSRIQGESSARG